MNLFLIGLKRGLILFAVLFGISLLNRFLGEAEQASVYLFNAVVLFFLGLTSVIYQIDKWSFKKQILVHYVSMLITVFPMALLSGFWPVNSFVDVLKVYLEFNLTGIALFFITYMISKLIGRFNNANQE